MRKMFEEITQQTWFKLQRRVPGQDRSGGDADVERWM